MAPGFKARRNFRQREEDVGKPRKDSEETRSEGGREWRMSEVGWQRYPRVDGAGYAPSKVRAKKYPKERHERA